MTAKQNLNVKAEPPSPSPLSVELHFKPMACAVFVFPTYGRQFGELLKCGVLAGAGWERGFCQGELGSRQQGRSREVPAGAAELPAQHPRGETPGKGDFSSL